ncbi:MAG: hypothetical protein INQ03_23595 [Candidatus Heimdallarchaeota archaeon]|nr:hypothetical protein [Candidatus Heimdallarchaeota archaeon]
MNNRNDQILLKSFLYKYKNQPSLALEFIRSIKFDGEEKYLRDLLEFEILNSLERNEEASEIESKLKMYNGDNIFIKAYYYLIIGYNIAIKENIIEGIRMVRKSISYFQDYGDPYHIIRAKNNLSVLYRYNAEYSKAEELLLEILGFLEDFNIQDMNGSIMANLGLIALAKNDLQKAQNFLKKAEESLEKMDKILLLIQTYFVQLLVSKRLNDTSRLNDYFQKIQRVDNSRFSGNNYANNLLKLSEAVFLMSKHRVKDTARSQVLLEDIVSNTHHDLEMKFYALINLLKLLIYELNKENHEAVMREIEKYLEILDELQFSNPVSKYMLEMFELRFRLYFIKEDFDHAFKILDRGLDYAKKSGSMSHYKELEQTKVKFINQMKNWQNLSEKSETIFNNLDKSLVQEYLDQVSTIIK